MRKKNLLILIILIALVGAIVGKKHSHKIQRYFAEEGYYKILQTLHLIKRCYQPMQNFQDIFEQEGMNYISLDRMVATDSIIKLSEPIDVSNQNNLKIPAISHHIYFSYSTVLSDFYQEKMKANFNRLNDSGIKWKHYIWTNNPKLFDKEILTIKGVEIRDPKELKDSILYNIFIDAFEKGEDSRAFFAESSDILRFVIIQKFGGIYTDMDYEIYDGKSLVELMKKFDFVGGRELTKLESYYGSSFFASKPNHPVINEAIARRYRNTISDNIPDYIKYPCYTNDFIYFNSPPLLTISYFAKNNIEGNVDVILPSWILFNHDFARFKNKTCHYSEVHKEQFNFDAAILPKLLEDFKKQLKPANSPLLQFKIIGADMFCGNWYDEEQNRKSSYHWNW